MQFNVAQLLRAPIGATQDKHILEDWASIDEDVILVAPVEGTVRLLRTDAGVLVQGSVKTVVELPCSRCLAPCRLPLEIALEEEFEATGRFATENRASEGAADPALLIDEQHVLDLHEVVRQQLLLELPIHPVCRPECAGLCPQCGEDLSEGPCSCTGEPDPRWTILEQLAGVVDEVQEGME